MGKTWENKSYLRRPVRSYLICIFVFTLIFCLANYILLRNMYPQINFILQHDLLQKAATDDNNYFGNRVSQSQQNNHDHVKQQQQIRTDPQLEKDIDELNDDGVNTPNERLKFEGYNENKEMNENDYLTQTETVNYGSLKETSESQEKQIDKNIETNEIVKHDPEQKDASSLNVSPKYVEKSEEQENPQSDVEDNVFENKISNFDTKLQYNNTISDKIDSKEEKREEKTLHQTNPEHTSQAQQDNTSEQRQSEGINNNENSNSTEAENFPPSGNLDNIVIENDEFSDKPGERGRPFTIPLNLREESQRRFSEFQLNIVASEMISLNRSLPDYRAAECQTIDYRKDLPLTSIVIVFRNEAWSTLLRTVWSAINRTPRQYLQEIILVDDASELEFLGKKLDDYVQTLPVTVKVLRMKTRSGLIKGRLYGVENAEGEAVIFLDAHCECTEGWIEPLLSRITENPKTIVSPLIDIIDENTFEYYVAGRQIGGFDWILDFMWTNIPQRELDRTGNDVTQAIRTPTIAGGLIAFNKDFFYEIGAYDEGMSIWGAENLEMSFRVWMCGGVLEVIQCSHVGHVYRTDTPHTFPDGVRSTIFKNKARVAEVWMDQWKEIFFALNPDAISGDVTNRTKLREDLKCQDFEWYLNNIYQETTLPLKFDHLGLIQNVETELCIVTTYNQMKNDILFEICSKTDPFQIFTYTFNEKIRYENYCLAIVKLESDAVVFKSCDESDDGQNWFYDQLTENFINKKTSKCLIQSKNNTATLTECDSFSENQHWKLLSFKN